ncbi:hypothetical protein CHU98_g1469 [Xylaria longipes]|nr:hypothetical protein CHU98_g1469 [Xylaria longipes]
MRGCKCWIIEDNITAGLAVVEQRRMYELYNLSSQPLSPFPGLCIPGQAMVLLAQQKILTSFRMFRAYRLAVYDMFSLGYARIEIRLTFLRSNGKHRDLSYSSFQSRTQSGTTAQWEKEIVRSRIARGARTLGWWLEQASLMSGSEVVQSRIDSFTRSGAFASDTVAALRTPRQCATTMFHSAHLPKVH